MASRIVYHMGKQYAAIRDLSSGRKHYRAMVGGRVLARPCATASEASEYRRRVLLRRDAWLTR